MLYYKSEVVEHDFKARLYSILRPSLAFFQNKKIKSIIHWGLLLCIFLYLSIKLSKIGWGNIIDFLPSSPLFYMLSIAIVALPIFAEYLSLRLILKNTVSTPFRLFIRKHVINEAVMSYAGEAYFIQQLSKFEGLNLRRAAIIIKNLALIRTFIANFKLLLFVLIVIFLGNLDSLLNIITISSNLALIVGGICLGICLGSLVFFRKLTQIEFSLAATIASVYLIRSLLIACFLIVQWSLTLPGTSLSVWMVFLVVYSISKKSPVGGDLVFVSVALTIPGLANDGAAIAAMLLTATAVVQIIYLLGFVTTLEIPTLKKLNLPLEP